MTDRGILTAVFGNTGTGKGVWVISQIQKKKISVVWDLKADRREYPCQYRCFNLADFSWLIANIKSGMICYSGNPSDFDGWCHKARLFSEKFQKNAAVVIDETSDVTNPGKARGAHGNLIRTGLNHGADFFVMCQRGAESDTTATGNASRFHFSGLATPDDEKRMAEMSRVPLAEIKSLKVDFENKKFQYIDVVRSQYWSKGELSFSGGKPKFKTLSSKNKI